MFAIRRILHIEVLNSDTEEIIASVDQTSFVRAVSFFCSMATSVAESASGPSELTPHASLSKGQQVATRKATGLNSLASGIDIDFIGESPSRYARQ